MNALKLAMGLLGNYLAKELKERFSLFIPYIKKITLGIVLMLVSFLLWIGGFILLLQALFFHLAHLDQFVMPALWTAGACLCAALAVVCSGFLLIKIPR